MSEKVIIKNCTLYHGDCFEILSEISEADCMITDPPYGCTCNDWDYDIDLDKFWSISKAACKKNAPFVIFCQMPFAARLYMSNPKMFRYEWIYKKTFPSGFLDCNKKPLREHELIYIFSDNMPKYYPQKTKGLPYKARSSGYSSCYNKITYFDGNYDGLYYPKTIIDIPVEKDFRQYNKNIQKHPTQKSVAVLSYLVKTYTDAGNAVLDLFMGSGSTGVAAVKHGRKFIGIEQDQKWFDVACKRIEAEYQNRSLLDVAENANA